MRLASEQSLCALGTPAPPWPSVQPTSRSPLPWKETDTSIAGSSFPSPFLGPRGRQGHPPSPKTPTPGPSRLILLSILSDNKDTEGIYLYLQPANETIQWKAAPACWSLLRPLIASSVFQFPAFILHINFPRWIDTILLGNPFVPLAILFKSLVLLFIIIVKQ